MHTGVLEDVFNTSSICTQGCLKDVLDDVFNISNQFAQPGVLEDAFNINEIYPLGENKDDSIFLTAEADNEQLTSPMNEAAANDEVVESEAAVTSERGAE